MTIGSTASLGLQVAAPATGGDTPEKIRDSARQFESLLIAQVLKTGRESGGGGWLGASDDESGSIAIEMAEQQVAQTLAASGGLGLARLIEQGLIRDSQNAKDPAPTPIQTPTGSAG